MLMCWKMVKQALRNQKGQGMAEYGLIMALIAVVTVLAFTSLGTSIKAKIESVATSLAQ